MVSRRISGPNADGELEIPDGIPGMGRVRRALNRKEAAGGFDVLKRLPRTTERLQQGWAPRGGGQGEGEYVSLSDDVGDVMVFGKMEVSLGTDVDLEKELVGIGERNTFEGGVVVEEGGARKFLSQRQRTSGVGPVLPLDRLDTKDVLRDPKLRRGPRGGVLSEREMEHVRPSQRTELNPVQAQVAAARVTLSGDELGLGLRRRLANFRERRDRLEGEMNALGVLSEDANKVRSQAWMTVKTRRWLDLQKVQADMAEAERRATGLGRGGKGGGESTFDVGKTLLLTQNAYRERLYRTVVGPSGADMRKADLHKSVAAIARAVDDAVMPPPRDAFPGGGRARRRGKPGDRETVSRLLRDGINHDVIHLHRVAVQRREEEMGAAEEEAARARRERVEVLEEEDKARLEEEREAEARAEEKADEFMAYLEAHRDAFFVGEHSVGPSAGHEGGDDDEKALQLQIEEATAALRETHPSVAEDLKSPEGEPTVPEGEPTVPEEEESKVEVEDPDQMRSEALLLPPIDKVRRKHARDPRSKAKKGTGAAGGKESSQQLSELSAEELQAKAKALGVEPLETPVADRLISAGKGIHKAKGGDDTRRRSTWGFTGGHLVPEEKVREYEKMASKLEGLWTVMKVPPTKKLEMIFRFTTESGVRRLPGSIPLWEGAMTKLEAFYEAVDEVSELEEKQVRLDKMKALGYSTEAEGLNELGRVLMGEREQSWRKLLDLHDQCKAAARDIKRVVKEELYYNGVKYKETAKELEFRGGVVYETRLKLRELEASREEEANA